MPHTPSGQSRVYRVTQLRTDGIHCRESAGTEAVVLKVVLVTGAVFAGHHGPINVRLSFPATTIDMKWAFQKYEVHVQNSTRSLLLTQQYSSSNTESLVMQTLLTAKPARPDASPTPDWRELELELHGAITAIIAFTASCCM